MTSQSENIAAPQSIAKEIVSNQSANEFQSEKDWNLISTA